jgi:hypothetical protein
MMGTVLATTRRYGCQSMVAPLRRALVHVPGPEYDAQGWRAYGYEGEPDRDRAIREHEGGEVSIRRISGPTCNSRPLLRA